MKKLLVLTIASLFGLSSLTFAAAEVSPATSTASNTPTQTFQVIKGKKHKKLKHVVSKPVQKTQAGVKVIPHHKNVAYFKKHKAHTA